jgi:NADH:ubiquinone oxidoreductase subunit 4 (subunit M)
MVEIIKTASVGFICYESLKCFGKKDYADVVAFCSVLSTGVMIIGKIGGWYNGLMNSQIVQLAEKIFG